MTTTEFERLQEGSRPHIKFKKDWNIYYSLDFANTFLPNVKIYKGTALNVFDGAQVFSNTQKAKKKVLPLGVTDNLISTIVYTFPEGVEAEEQKNKVEMASHELGVFMKISQNEKVVLSLKCGKQFEGFYNDFYNSNSQLIAPSKLDTITFETSITDLKKHFDKELLQERVIQLVLNQLGVEYNSVIQQYDSLIEEALGSINIFGKYVPKIIVEKSQSIVFEKTKRTEPTPNQILIWLVSEDKIEFDNFIIVQFGSNVAKDFKERNIDESNLTSIILNFIQLELGEQPIKETKIEGQTGKSIRNAELNYRILGKAENDTRFKKLLELDPYAAIAIATLEEFSKDLKQYELKSNRWLRNHPNYAPLFDVKDDPIGNAFRCGVYNGFIKQLSGFPQVISFFWELFVDEEKMQEFQDRIKKLLEDEDLLDLLLQSALKGYINEDDPDQLAYQFGLDIFTVIDIILGFVTFVKGVASFVNLIKKAAQFIRRFGKEGLDLLKKLKNNPKELEKLFSDLDARIKNISRRKDWMASNFFKFGNDSHTFRNGIRLQNRPDDGWFHVLAHGDGKRFIIDGRKLKPEEFAKLLLARGYQKGDPIRLVVCFSGAKSNGPAAKLSKILNARIEAPTHKIRLDDFNDFIIDKGGKFVTFEP